MMVRGGDISELVYNEVRTHSTVMMSRGSSSTLKAKGYKGGIYTFERHRDGIIARRDREAVLIPWTNIRYCVLGTKKPD